MSTPEESPQASRFEQSPILDMQFPPLSRTVGEVSALMAESGESPDTPKLADIVNRDPVMAATVLRRVNSAYYGMSRRVTNIATAVRLLGFVEVCHIVLTASMLNLQDVLRTPTQSQMYDRMIETSLGAAFYAQELAAHLGLPLSKTAFTAGLLHPIGRLILLYNRPAEYERLFATAGDYRMPSADSEELVFGTDHAKLGAKACAHWNLPETVTRVIRYQHSPGLLKETDLRTLALCLAVAADATAQLALPALHVGESAEAQLMAAMELREPSETDLPVHYEAGMTLTALCRASQGSPVEAMDFIDAKRDESIEYIRSMMQGAPAA